MIKKHWPGYEKNMPDLYSRLYAIADIDIAIKNAERNAIEAKKENRDNPYTRIHELVVDLQKMAASDYSFGQKK